MEKISSNTNHSPSSPVANLVEFLLFHGILRWILIRLHSSYSSFKYFLQSHVVGKSKGRLECKNYSVSINKVVVDDGKIGREDVEWVMGNLRIVCDPHGEKLQERLGKDEISVLFEDKEPSLEEVKGAFDVFDVNGDGFVDARKLQRVLGALGLQEEAEMDNCRRMIRGFDENGDGRIDFTEFVKLTERSFC